MATQPGPQGTGLIPPGTGAGETTGTGDGNQPNGTPPEGQNGQQTGSQQTTPPANDDIDGAPPVPQGESGGDDGNEGGETPPEGGQQTPTTFDPQAFQTQILDEVQRRFDRAISTALRNAGGQNSGAGSGSGDGGGTGGDGGQQQQPPPRQDPPPPRDVDVRTLRFLVRDRITDEMEQSGSTERKVVKDVLDQIVPLIDWSKVDDEDKLVGELVTALKGKTTDLIKVGSDRKVAQLRSMGLIPEKEGQPGGGSPGQTAAPPATQMQKGEEYAKRRWPEGKRRMGG